MSIQSRVEMMSSGECGMERVAFLRHGMRQVVAALAPAPHPQAGFTPIDVDIDIAQCSGVDVAHCAVQWCGCGSLCSAVVWMRPRWATRTISVDDGYVKGEIAKF